MVSYRRLRRQPRLKIVFLASSIFGGTALFDAFPVAKGKTQGLKLRKTKPSSSFSKM